MGGVTPHGIRYPDGASKAKNLGPELKTMAEDIDWYIGSYLSPTGPIRQIIIGVAEEIVPPMIPPLVEEYLEEHNVARRTDPGYPEERTSAGAFYEVVDQRGQLTFLQVRRPDGAPSHASGRLIAKTLQELGYTLSGDGGGGGGGDGTSPSGPIACFGDSMTDDDNWVPRLAELIGVQTVDKGEAGQTTTEVAFRSGALKVNMTVAGNTIPASGSVAVTALSPSTDWRTVTVQWTERGYLGGVLGTFRHATTTNGGMTFVRDKPGTAVVVPAGSPFTVAPDEKTGRGYERTPAIIWAGRNNHTALSNIQRDIAAMMTHFTSDRKLLLSITNTQGEPSGSAGYVSVIAANNWMKSTYPDHYVDIRRWLIDDALREMGLTATSADNTAISEDRIPPQLMNDSTHLTPATSTALGDYLAFVWREKGL